MKSYKELKENYALPIQPINTNTKQYKQLEPYLSQKDMTLVVSQRPVPSSDTINLLEEVYIGFGSFYGVGKLEEWATIWEELDARIVVPISNEDIIRYLEWELAESESLTLDEALEKVDGELNQLCEMFDLPYVC